MAWGFNPFEGFLWLELLRNNLLTLPSYFALLTCKGTFLYDFWEEGFISCLTYLLRILSVRVPTLSGESLLLEHYLERALGFEFWPHMQETENHRSSICLDKCQQREKRWVMIKCGVACRREGSFYLFGLLQSLVFGLIMPYNYVIFSMMKRSFKNMLSRILFYFSSPGRRIAITQDGEL